MIRISSSQLACIVCIVLSVCVVPAWARIDTVKKDNGVAAAPTQLRDGWEESVILSVGQPCRLKKILVYYASGTGLDQIKVTGDASEGTIPPSQYCFTYNTLAEEEVTISAKGWVERSSWRDCHLQNFLDLLLLTGKL